MSVRSRSRLSLLLVAALSAAAPARAAGLDEAQVRGFVAQQHRAWNAGSVDAFFAAFRPGATFTDQYRTPAGKVVPYGTSTLAEALAQTRRFRTQSKTSEAGEIVRITLGPDGRSARVISREVSRIETTGRVRVVCAERVQDLTLAAGRLRSGGQTDTFSPCPR